MNQKIWYELVHAKKGEIYLSYYLCSQKDRRRFYNIALIVFSISGVFGWKIWNDYPAIVCLGISIMTVISRLESYIIRSEDDIEKICELRNQYLRNFNKLEKLYSLYSNNKFTEEEACEQFYAIRELAAETEALDNRLNIKKIRKLNKQADQDATDYINQYLIPITNGTERRTITEPATNLN